LTPLAAAPPAERRYPPAAGRGADRVIRVSTAAVVLAVADHSDDVQLDREWVVLPPWPGRRSRLAGTLARTVRAGQRVDYAGDRRPACLPAARHH
jgi:hypothetical protein